MGGDLHVRAAGAWPPSPVDAARTLLACIDGVILDQLIRPQDLFEAAPVPRPVVAALAGGGQQAAP